MTLSHAHVENLPPLPKDPGSAMQEMMSTIDALRKVYIRENDALASSNTKAFLDLQDEKLAAARIYQRRIEEIMGRRAEMKNVSPVAKQKLEVMQQEFAIIARANMESIDRMRRCVTRLGDTISSAAREAAKKQRAFSYGETGKIRGTSKRSVSMGLSETA
jgi:hypothetical protein